MATTLEQSIIDAAPNGVSVVNDLPGGWTAIVAKHPNKVPLVDYTKHPPEALLRFKMAVAERWAA
jgi:hypothetical protein